MHIVDARSCEKKWRANMRESTRCAIACGSLKRGQCFHTHQTDFGAGLGAEFFPRDVEIKLTTVVQLLPVVHSNAVAAQKEYGLDEIATPRIYLREKGSWRGPPSHGTVCVFVIFHRVLLPIETNKTFQVLFCCDHLIRIKEPKEGSTMLRFPTRCHFLLRGPLPVSASNSPRFDRFGA